MSSAVASVSSGASSPRTWNLALCFQEVFTAISRLRFSGQSVADATSFRNQLKAALGSAKADAQAHGYAVEDIDKAIFVVVGFIDESVLSTRSHAQAEWALLPLAEEFYGRHDMGELFFRELDSVLERPDSADTADLLEIYLLCLQLGFRGRYGATGNGELDGVVTQVQDKMRRIRGSSISLSLHSAPPAEKVPPVRRDPWIGRLAGLAVVLLVVGLLFFVFAKWQLGSGVSNLHAVAAESRN